MELLHRFFPFLTVVTFVAGYLLSNLDRFRESRRKIRNMKMILFKELSESYKLLNKIMPTGEYKPHPDQIAGIAQRFSFAVFDRYLDRIDQLRSKELSAIYEASVMLRNLKIDGNAFLTASHGADASRDNLQAYATLLFTKFPQCHELLAAALRVLPEGAFFLQGQEADRGRALTLTEELLRQANRATANPS